MQKPSIATNEASATADMKIEATKKLPAIQDTYATAKQVMAIVELNFCYVTSSGI